MSKFKFAYEAMMKFDIGSFDKRISEAKEQAICCIERADFLEAIAHCVYGLELQAGMKEAEYQHTVVSMLSGLEEEANANKDN